MATRMLLASVSQAWEAAFDVADQTQCDWRPDYQADQVARATTNSRSNQGRDHHGDYYQHMVSEVVAKVFHL